MENNKNRCRWAWNCHGYQKGECETHKKCPIFKRMLEDLELMKKEVVE